jgi:hypothetical protein
VEKKTLPNNGTSFQMMSVFKKMYQSHIFSLIMFHKLQTADLNPTSPPFCLNFDPVKMLEKDGLRLLTLQKVF